MFIKKPKKTELAKMRKEAGWRENNILNNAKCYVSGNHGRTIDIYTKDGKRCQWDTWNKKWTN